MRKPNKKKRFKLVKRNPKPNRIQEIYSRLVKDMLQSLPPFISRDNIERQKEIDNSFNDWFNSILSKVKERQNKP